MDSFKTIILILEQAAMLRSVQAENQRLKETIEKLEKELILSMAKCFAIEKRKK